jgi:hypothetical protein
MSTFRVLTSARTHNCPARLALGLVGLAILVCSSPSWAKTKTVRKVQEVNFSEMNIKGTIRNPDGAYLVQKKGIKFMPLHDVKKDMDSKIRDSVNYL